MRLSSETKITKLVPIELVSEKHQAYTYRWTVKNPSTGDDHFYVGRRHEEYTPDKYMHSSKDKNFHNMYSKSDSIKFEVLGVGTHEEMALMEHSILQKNEASTSPLWFNNHNGAGGKGGKGVSQSYWVDSITEALRELLSEHTEIEFGEVCEYGITKASYPKAELHKIVIQKEQFLQTRNKKFDANHVISLSEKFNKNSDPDDWPPIVVLLDAKIVDNDISYEKGGVVVISGNHRSRGLSRSTNGISINAFQIPHSFWKKLDRVDLTTLSNRFNPNPEMPELKQDHESAATWVIDFCMSRNLEETHSDGETKIPQVTHQLVKKELIEVNNFSQGDYNATIKLCRKHIESNFLSVGDNLLDWSVDGLKLDPVLNMTYELYKKDMLEKGIFTDIYKISGNALHIGKLADRIYDVKNDEIKSGVILEVEVYYSSTKEKDSKECQKMFNKTKTVAAPWQSYGIDINFNILPITHKEFRYSSKFSKYYDRAVELCECDDTTD